MLPKLLEVSARPDHHLYLRYADGLEGEIGVGHLRGMGVFRAWDDGTAPFHQAYLDAESGAVAWNDDLDLSPHHLYEKLAAQQAASTALRAVA